MVRTFLVFAALIAATMSTSVSEAASVRFAGNLTNLAGPDNLGLAGLNSTAFEAIINSTGNAINSGYIVFEGVFYNFATGTVAPNAAGINPEFHSMALTHGGTNAASGTLTFNFGAGASNVQGNTQAAYDLFANRVGAGGNNTGFSAPGTFSIVNGGATYSGAVNAVPEPASMLLLGSLVAGCGGFTYRRNRKLATAAPEVAG